MEPDDDKTQSHFVLTKGTMVSHYRIIDKIGAGGMGMVRLAAWEEFAKFGRIMRSSDIDGLYYRADLHEQVVNLMRLSFMRPCLAVSRNQ